MASSAKTAHCVNLPQILGRVELAGIHLRVDEDAARSFGLLQDVVDAEQFHQSSRFLLQEVNLHVVESFSVRVALLSRLRKYLQARYELTF